VLALLSPQPPNPPPNYQLCSLHFDGIDDYLLLPLIQDMRALSGWFYLDAQQVREGSRRRK
jgi:hypothetical protein